MEKNNQHAASFSGDSESVLEQPTLGKLSIQIAMEPNPLCVFGETDQQRCGIYNGNCFGSRLFSNYLATYRYPDQSHAGTNIAIINRHRLIEIPLDCKRRN